MPSCFRRAQAISSKSTSTGQHGGGKRAFAVSCSFARRRQRVLNARNKVRPEASILRLSSSVWGEYKVHGNREIGVRLGDGLKKVEALFPCP